MAQSIRLNFRIPNRLYERMLKMGHTLGLDTPSAAARHFLSTGIQVSMGSYTSSESLETQTQMLQLFQGAIGEDAKAVQPDLLGGAAEKIKARATAKSSKGKDITTRKKARQ